MNKRAQAQYVCAIVWLIESKSQAKKWMLVDSFGPLRECYYIFVEFQNRILQSLCMES